jgi:hypothetical protein
MSIKKFLQEEYMGITQGHSSSLSKGKEIYRNPDTSEIRKLMGVKDNTVKFLIDPKNKDLYAFPMNVLHNDGLWTVARLTTKEKLELIPITFNSETPDTNIINIDDKMLQYNQGDIRYSSYSYNINDFKWLIDKLHLIYPTKETLINFNNKFFNAKFNSLGESLLKQYLTEEYFMTTKSNSQFLSKDGIVIYKNPDTSEIRKMLNDYGVRFVIDEKTKDVYAWADSLVHISGIRHVCEIEKDAYKHKFISAMLFRNDTSLVIGKTNIHDKLVFWCGPSYDFGANVEWDTNIKDYKKVVDKCKLAFPDEKVYVSYQGDYYDGNKKIVGKSLTESLEENWTYFKKTTDFPLYDNMLKNPDYFKKAKNLTSEIVWMTPLEYIQKVAKMQQTTVDKQFSLLDFVKIDKIVKSVKAGSKMDLPFLDYDTNLQEGRHRAIAASKLEMKKIPVMVIKKIANEEFFLNLAGKNDPGEYSSYDIYKNPDTSELRKLVNRYKEIRLLIDVKDKSFFAFSSENMTHYKALNYIIEKDKTYATKWLLTGFFGNIVSYYGLYITTSMKYNPKSVWMYDQSKKPNNINELEWLTDKLKLVNPKKNFTIVNYGKIVNEEYFTAGKSLLKDGKSYEIYKNPSVSELKKLLQSKKFDCIKGSGEIRILVDNENKDLYAWEADKVIHIDGIRELAKENKGFRDKFFICGFYGTKKNKMSLQLVDKQKTGFVYNNIDITEDIDDFRWLIDKLKEVDPKKKLEIVFKEKIIKEEYLGAAVPYLLRASAGKDIYENPDTSELRKLWDNGNRDIRFLVDFKNKKLYAFDDILLHVDAMYNINRLFVNTKDNLYVKGMYYTTSSNAHITFDIMQYYIERGGEPKSIPVSSIPNDIDWLVQKFKLVKTSLPLSVEFQGKVINESWVIDARKGAITFTVYSNPSISELVSLVKQSGNKDVRFIIDPDSNKTYVFDNNILHDWAFESLKKNDIKISTQIRGEGTFKGGKIDMTDKFKNVLVVFTKNDTKGSLDVSKYQNLKNGLLFNPPIEETIKRQISTREKK